MNLTAVLDVTAQRAPSPLDRSVSEGGGDSAFAGVMSQYGPDGGGKSATDPGAAATSTAEAAAPAGTQAGAAQPTSEAAQTGPTAAGAAVQATGETLPSGAPATGQTLPLDPSIADLGAALDARAAQPTDDTKDTVDTTADPTAVAMLAAFAVPPPAAVVAAPAPVATGSAPPVDATLSVPTVVAKPATAAAGADPVTAVNVPAPDDGGDSTPLDPSAFERIRAQLDRLQRGNDVAPTSEPRRGPDPTAAASSVAAAAASAPSGSVLQTMRGLLRGRTDPPQPLTAARGRDVRIDADAAATATKPVATAPLAPVFDAIARKDPSAESDTPDASIRVDATQGRAAGTDTVRDAPPSRLGDVAQQHAQRFAGEIADRVIVMRNQRLDGATVTLEPRDLGRIDIQIRVQADTTHVAFTAQHAAVRDALEGQLPRLRSMLEDAGLSLGAVDVAHSGARNATGGDAGTSRTFESPRAITGADTDAVDTAAWRPRASTSLIDLHA